MPETIEVSPGTLQSRSQPAPSLIVVGDDDSGGGCDVRNLMAAAEQERQQQQSRQKFLLISRRTTTTVFAKHDQTSGGDEVVDGTTTVPHPPKQVRRRRQFSCPMPDETSHSLLSASHPTETHFEWRQGEHNRNPKGSVLLLRQWTGPEDDMLDKGAAAAGTNNKIRLKIVW